MITNCMLVKINELDSFTPVIYYSIWPKVTQVTEINHGYWDTLTKF